MNSSTWTNQWWLNQRCNPCITAYKPTSQAPANPPHQSAPFPQPTHKANRTKPTHSRYSGASALLVRDTALQQKTRAMQSSATLHPCFCFRLPGLCCSPWRATSSPPDPRSGMLRISINLGVSRLPCLCSPAALGKPGSPLRSAPHCQPLPLVALSGRLPRALTGGGRPAAR